MNDKILGDMIYKLRREQGISQSELAQKIGVTNKAVSKWETYEANPDLGNLTKLADIFGVSCDDLLRGKVEKCDVDGGIVKNANLLFIEGVSQKTDKSYEFVSKKQTKKGTPYVHINLGVNKDGSIKKAKGIIAVGIIAQGIISLGIVSVGIISLGIFALGLIAAGAFSLGALIALGGVAVGVGVSVGAIAVGTIAVGAVSIGVISVGAMSIGVYAHTGVFGKAIGLYTIIH